MRNRIFFIGCRDAIYELDKNDKVLREIKPSGGGYFRLLRMTEEGNFLFTSGTTKIKEIDNNGKLVWSWHNPERAGSLHGIAVIE